jgi:7,8-dihydro-6-hydroxymethylpterin-pyrophosphokinase
MKITKISSLTGAEHTMDIDVTFEQLWKIDNRTDLVQRIVPHLSPAEREFLLTGITNEEWQTAFADMEE